MPYETNHGTFERASRVGHRNAAVRAAAERRQFHVPAEEITDLAGIRERVRPRSSLPVPDHADRLRAAIALDGSRAVEQVRDGLPSVRYGFAQTAAAYLDLAALESQRHVRFVDPKVLHDAVNKALVSFDLPTSGAFEREGISIAQSWREAICRIFRTKKVEVNHLDRTLLDLLFLLHGEPGHPATTLPVNCPVDGCDAEDVPVPGEAADSPTPDGPPVGMPCPSCDGMLLPTDVLRIHEEVVDEGSNEAALGRLMSVCEMLVLVGLAELLFSQHRHELLPSTLFIIDGPLAMYGPPAKLRGRALEFFQRMAAHTPGHGPYVVGIEKTGATVDYANALVRNGVLAPGDLLVLDTHLLSQMTNATNVMAYGKETYWGRKFVYRTLDGQVLVPTVMPPSGAPYDAHGGQPDPAAYPTLPAILDVFDRTGSSMYRNGIIPVALAHEGAAFPIGVGSDVLKLVAADILGLSGNASATTGAT